MQLKIKFITSDLKSNLYHSENTNCECHQTPVSTINEGSKNLILSKFVLIECLIQTLIIFMQPKLFRILIQSNLSY